MSLVGVNSMGLGPQVLGPREVVYLRLFRLPYWVTLWVDP